MIDEVARRVDEYPEPVSERREWRESVRTRLQDFGEAHFQWPSGYRRLLFGDALFDSADTTAAGIYQRMKQDARPIALDELEPGADPRKVANVVQLMRDASSVLRPCAA